MCSIDNIVLYYHNKSDNKIDLSTNEDFIKQIQNYEPLPEEEDWTVLSCYKSQVIVFIMSSKELIINPKHIALIHLEDSSKGITLYNVTQFKEDRMPIFYYAEDKRWGGY